TFVSVEEQDKFGRIEKFLEKEIEKLPIPQTLGNAPDYNPAANGGNNRFSRDGKGRNNGQDNKRGIKNNTTRNNRHIGGNRKG
ncbi:MAG: ATP-dependent helicase, partial [Bacteroidales bacterium]